MSGIHARSRNDKCAVEEYYADSVEPANYALEPCSRVNPSFQKSTDVVCKNKDLGCNKFSDSNANMNLGPESFGQRIDLEENLRGTNRVLSQCLASKHYPCEFDSVNRLEGECTNVITVNPRLYERDIAPTNMPTEFEKGW
jgi:hypothetical protein